jgi:hypothetical protein
MQKKWSYQSITHSQDLTEFFYHTASSYGLMQYFSTGGPQNAASPQILVSIMFYLYIYIYYQKLTIL